MNIRIISIALIISNVFCTPMIVPLAEISSHNSNQNIQIHETINSRMQSHSVSDTTVKYNSQVSDDDLHEEISPKIQQESQFFEIASIISNFQESPTAPPMKDVSAEYSEFVAMHKIQIAEMLLNPSKDKAFLEKFLEITRSNGYDIDNIKIRISTYLYENALLNPLGKGSTLFLQALKVCMPLPSQRNMFNAAVLKFKKRYYIYKQYYSLQNAFQNPLDPNMQQYIDLFILNAKNVGFMDKDTDHVLILFNSRKLTQLRSPKNRHIVYPLTIVLNNQLKHKCVLTKELGRGSYGVAFEAYFESDPTKLVVLKTLHYDVPDSLEMVTTERDVLESLDRLVLFDPKNLIVVQVKIDGPTLESILLDDNYSDAYKNNLLVKYLATSREFYINTGNKYIHGDIRPANVIVSNEKMVLIDFGLCKTAPINPRKLLDEFWKERIYAKNEFDLIMAKHNYIRVSKNLNNHANNALQNAMIRYGLVLQKTDRPIEIERLKLRYKSLYHEDFPSEKHKLETAENPEAKKKQRLQRRALDLFWDKNF